MRKGITVGMFCVGLLNIGSVFGATEFAAPPGAGIVDVREYGAVPDDGKDDTDAIQKALSAFPHGHRIIYLPNGVFTIAKRLDWPRGVNDGQFMKYTTLQGESTDGAILELPDGAPGFDNPEAPQAMIFTGGQPAQRFGNEVRNLTIRTGKNNPGAIGLQFNASNYGCVRNVKIESGDGKGVIGLDMSFTGEIGPLLVKNLKVVGFDYGIKTQENEASQTLDTITLEGQNKCGLYNRNQSVVVRNLTTVGATTAVSNDDHSGMVVVVDGDFTYTGSGAPPAAVQHSPRAAATYLRNVKTHGFARAVEVIGEPGKGVKTADVTEWYSSPVKSLFNSPTTALKLTPKDTPVAPVTTHFSDWADPRTFGAIPGDEQDDTDAIQKAIDSGKGTVWFPTGDMGKGEFTVNGTLHVRGNVAHLIGFSGRLRGKGTVRFEDGDAPVVIAERIAFGFFSEIRVEVDTKRTVAFVDCTIDNGLFHTGPGELFIENVVTWGVFKGGPVYARQINPEVPGTHLLFDGAKAWIHGMKVEVKGTILEARNNATVELIGLFVYASHRLDESPMFIVTDSRLSSTFREKSNFPKPYPIVLQETRKGVTRRWANKTQGGSAAALMTAYPPGKAVALTGTATIEAEAVSPSEIRVKWKDVFTGEDGFVVERSLDGRTWATAGEAPINAEEYVDSALAFGTAYSYRLRAYNDAGQSALSEVATGTTLANAQQPLAPTSVTATATAGDTIAVEWVDASNNEERFVVERRPVQGDQFKPVGQTAVNETRFTDHVDPGSGFVYRVRAVNALGATVGELMKPVFTLPKDWTADALGEPKQTGTVVFDGTGWVITSGGGTFHEAADSFYYVAGPVASGDVTVTFRADAYTEANAYGVAGAMFRGGRSPDAPFVALGVRVDNSVAIMYRAKPGEPAKSTQDWIQGSTAKWLRLTRNGDKFRGFFSTRAQPGPSDWVEVVPPPAIALGDAPTLGLAIAPLGIGSPATFKVSGWAVSSGPADLPAPAADLLAAQADANRAPAGPKAVERTDDTLPAGWQSFDVGGAPAGTTKFDKATNTFTVTGGGAEIWRGNDQCHFVGKPIDGDFEAVVQVSNVVDIGTPYAESGLMLRASPESNSAFAGVLGKSDLYVNMVFRPDAGKDAGQTGWEGPAAQTKWLKLVRKGKEFAGYQSADGQTWTQLGGPREANLPPQAMLGFAVNSNAADRTTSATFSNLAITTAPQK